MPIKPDDDKARILPSTWQQGWKPEQLAWLKKTIPQIQYAFEERDHEAFIQMWSISEREDRQFISMGIRKSGKQANGNNYSILFAFGFFQRHAQSKWMDGYIDYMADRAVEVYAEFLNDGPWTQHTDIHTANPHVIRDADVIARITASDAKLKRDKLWAAIEADEVDPLS